MVTEPALPGLASYQGCLLEAQEQPLPTLASSANLGGYHPHHASRVSEGQDSGALRVGADITLPEARAGHAGPSNLTGVDSLTSGGPAPRWAITAAASRLELPGCRV